MKIGDFLILGIIISLFFGIGIYFAKNISENNYIEIRQDNKIIKTIKSGYNDVFTVEKNGIFNKIEISNNKIRVLDANCHDKVCVHSGFIEKTGEIIVCLPSKLVIKIVGEKNDDLDYVVG